MLRDRGRGDLEGWRERIGRDRGYSRYCGRNSHDRNASCGIARMAEKRCEREEHWPATTRRARRNRAIGGAALDAVKSARVARSIVQMGVKHKN